MHKKFITGSSQVYYVLSVISMCVAMIYTPTYIWPTLLVLNQG